MNHRDERMSAGKVSWRLLVALVIASLLFTIALAGNVRPPAAEGGVELAAQAEPAPIALEPLTSRAEFTDAVSFDLTIGLQDGETITLSVAEPGRNVTAKITVQPGARFPWHTHPGPVFVNIMEGELVYVPANDCIERHYPAGTVFVDPGRGNVHTAYNAADVPTVFMATFFEIPAEGPLTITEGVAEPADCDVEVGVHQH
ncbi:MAG TPA: cupin domain-containing protein [Trueperaceae bacterium]